MVFSGWQILTVTSYQMQHENFEARLDNFTYVCLCCHYAASLENKNEIKIKKNFSCGCFLKATYHTFVMYL